eukprot:Skav201717  [mRNA]  locus=scaffold311:364020:372474:+ [translate_table: standard]
MSHFRGRIGIPRAIIFAIAILRQNAQQMRMKQTHRFMICLGHSQNGCLMEVFHGEIHISRGLTNIGSDLARQALSLHIVWTVALLIVLVDAVKAIARALSPLLCPILKIGRQVVVLLTWQTAVAAHDRVVARIRGGFAKLVLRVDMFSRLANHHHSVLQGFEVWIVRHFEARLK